MSLRTVSGRSPIGRVIVWIGLLGRLAFFRYGLAIILAFTGAKMLAADVIHISAAASVLVIAAVLLATVLLSVVLLRSPKRGTA